MLMDRESFLRGVAALRREIAALEVQQRADKVIIHMPHDSAECRAVVRADGEARGKRYLEYYDVGSVQSRIAMRKVQITARLVTYNLVRGKGVPYRVDSYHRAEYTRQLQAARQIFDNAVADKPVEVGAAT